MIAERILERAREELRTVLTEIEAKQVLEEAGIKCTDTRLARTKTEAVSASEEIGYPVVLKVSSVDISHKSDAGGVKVNLPGRSEVEQAFDEIMASCKAVCPDASIEGVSVQRMVRAGVEIIMGMYKDADFGPVVMFGLGGVLVEVLEDVAFRIVPIERADAAEMIHEIQGRKLLEGYRGQDPVDIPCLEDMLVKLSDFVNRTPTIEEIDINPVFAYREGAVAVDARIVVSA